MAKRTKARAASPAPGEIMIYSEIGASPDGTGITAASVTTSLKALGGKDVTVRINSPGGDVCDGLAIYNALKGYPGEVTAQIDGLAASAASLIAMAADRIVMPANAMFLIHEPRFDALGGTADDLTQAAGELQVMTASFVAAYAERTDLDADAVAALMKEDRIMSAAEAKALGFADEIADAVKMTASYPLKRLPAKARAVMEAALTQGSTMTKRTPVKKPASASRLPDLSIEEMKKMKRALAKALADAGEDDDEDEDKDEKDAGARASDDDGQSGTESDDPEARASDDDEDADKGDDDQDANPAPKSKDKAKARGARTFKSGQEQAFAYAQQVTELCNLAGLPSKAAAYIGERKAVAEVRADLLKARASNTVDPITAQHRYGGSRGPAVPEPEAKKGWDNAVAKANSTVRRGKARKG